MRIDSADECIWRDGERVGVPPKVTETVLNNAVGQLRQALGDAPKRPRFIETVVHFRFRYEPTELGLQEATYCQLIGHIDGDLCTIVAVNGLPTTEPH